MTHRPQCELHPWDIWERLPHIQTHKLETCVETHWLAGQREEEVLLNRCCSFHADCPVLSGLADTERITSNSPIRLFPRWVESGSYMWAFSVCVYGVLVLSHYGYGCMADYAQTLFWDCTAKIQAVHMTYHHNDSSELRCHHITVLHYKWVDIYIFCTCKRCWGGGFLWHL